MHVGQDVKAVHAMSQGMQATARGLVCRQLQGAGYAGSCEGPGMQAAARAGHAHSCGCQVVHARTCMHPWGRACRSSPAGRAEGTPAPGGSGPGPGSAGIKRACIYPKFLTHVCEHVYELVPVHAYGYVCSHACEHVYERVHAPMYMCVSVCSCA